MAIKINRLTTTGHDAGGYSFRGFVDYPKTDGYVFVDTPGRFIADDADDGDGYCYIDYGAFGNEWIFDTLVSWNKPFLKEIYDRLEIKNPRYFGRETRRLALAYQDGNGAVFTEELSKFPEEMRWKWKTLIGLTITYNNNRSLPVPVKCVAPHYGFPSFLSPKLLCDSDGNVKIQVMIS